MRANCHNRLVLTRSAYATLASFLFWTMAAFVPPTARAAEPTLGLATGSQEAQVTTDGQRWTTLPSSSNPLYEGTMLRTGKGTASVMLKDGTQMELQPHTLVGLAGSRTAPVVKVAVGQVLFRVPSSSRAALVTPSVRYQTDNGNTGDRPTILKAKSSTLSTTDSVGTIVVNSRGGSRLSLQQGEILARSAGNPGLHIVKAGQSVYIPQVGAPDHNFGVMLAQALPGNSSGLPAGAVPVYGENGKSIGYITDGSFTGSPGITANLPNPVPSGTIPADANIPPGATPIFTGDPAYAGYILDDKLAAYIPPGGGALAGAEAGAAAGAGIETETAVGVTVGLAAIGLGVGLGLSQSGGNGNGKASESSPAKLE
ncbi:FecR protein [Candidatus Methylomirabilis lanthanidiphila]|uniref:FecR protein n=1 Tax=Candidatus Methylomirabilis lanthanidiphila TaxID=2211376 RepID=A0A564ZHM1_9BACT|nr:FecR domain-containing protein [Candidatus Methylomirabilis lanthanidiphila]VUZ84821.1 FecR protein [Candidatus Methylomirabilis lanthanidiphila]